MPEEQWAARKQAKREQRAEQDIALLAAAGIDSVAEQERHFSELSESERAAFDAQRDLAKYNRAKLDYRPEQVQLPRVVAQRLEQAVKAAESDAHQRPTECEDESPALRRAHAVSAVAAPPLSTATTNVELMAAFKRQRLRDNYLSMQHQREQLPSFSQRAAIVEAVRRHQVVVISGETGCGKTTQVPQFILDDALAGGVGASCNILCTQPRRISAIGVAERVASERAETLGACGGLVGYQIRLEKRSSPSTRLLFCTAGILLRRLQTDGQLEGVSHVLLDEVHERSLDTDFLLIILRDLLVKRPGLRLVLMSATLNAEMFADYFRVLPSTGSSVAAEDAWRKPQILHIPGFTHAVEEFFLEDVVEACPRVSVDFLASSARHGGRRHRQRGGGGGGAGRGRRGPEQRRPRRGGDMGNEQPPQPVKRGARELTLEAGYSERTAKVVEHCVEATAESESAWSVPLLVELVLHVDAKAAAEGDDGAILVFLEGWDAITKLNDALSALPEARRWRLLPLHGSMPTQQQREIFKRPPEGVRKIVLATNIAESSITIDDVTSVLDCGKHKEKTYDAENKIGCLLPAWISQASAHQRRGRAGRTRPGRCFHLFPRSKMAELAEYQLAEMRRTPLEQLCLQVRQLRLVGRGEGGQLPKRGEIRRFLLRALTPPSEAAVAGALSTLTRIGALRAEDEELTVLGRHLAQLPMEPQIGKALIYAVLLGCLDPVMTIVGLLSHRSPFVLPLDKKWEADRAKRSFARGERSDHRALFGAFEAWCEAERRGEGAAFAWRNFLSGQALMMVKRMKEQFLQLLQSSGLLLNGDGSGGDELPFANRNSRRWAVVKAALAAGLYPNLVRVDPGRSRSKMFTVEHGILKLHPSSVNADEKGQQYWRHRWLVYHDKVKTVGGLFIYDSSEVSPLPLLLFGGEGELLELEHPKAASVTDAATEASVSGNAAAADEEDPVMQIMAANGGQQVILILPFLSLLPV